MTWSKVAFWAATAWITLGLASVSVGDKTCIWAEPAFGVFHFKQSWENELRPGHSDTTILEDTAILGSTLTTVNTEVGVLFNVSWANLRTELISGDYEFRFGNPDLCYVVDSFVIGMPKYGDPGLPSHAALTVDIPQFSSPGEVHSNMVSVGYPILNTQTARPGALRLEGEGTQWINNGGLYLGGGGSGGSLAITDGATWTNSANGAVYIGGGYAYGYDPIHPTAGTGEMLVEGDGSVFEALGLWQIGNNGTGEGTIVSGAQGRGTLLWIGSDCATGSLLVSGANSALDLSDYLWIRQGSATIEEGATISTKNDWGVGYDGIGSLAFTSGARGETADAVIGSSGAAGSLLVSGTNSGVELSRYLRVRHGSAIVEKDATLRSASSWEIGTVGAGKVSITSGAHAEGTSASVGSAEAAGELVVSGLDSKLELFGELAIHDGTVRVSNYGRLYVQSIALGRDPKKQTTIEVSTTGKIVVGSFDEPGVEGKIVLGNGSYLGASKGRILGGLSLRHGSALSGSLSVSGDLEQSPGSVACFGAGQTTSEAFGGISIGGQGSIRGTVRIDIVSRYTRPGTYRFNLFSSMSKGTLDWDPEEILLTDFRGGEAVQVPLGGDDVFGGWSLDNGVFEAEVTAVSLVFRGDANDDGMVNDLDASILAANWQAERGENYWSWTWADFNGDGHVDDLDASILAANWQYGVPTAAPEPTGLALMLGLAAALLTRRGRRT